MFADWTGVYHQNSPGYGFWSGIGSVFVPPILTILGFGLLYYWHHMCHNKITCFRWGHADQNGVVYCKKHNPYKVK